MSAYTAGQIVGPHEDTPRLQLRVDLYNDLIENSLSSLTALEATPILWPLDPAMLIDFWYGSPWLGAVGRLLADAVSSATFDLQPVSRRADGTRLGQGDGLTPHDTRQYDIGMAWLERDDVGQDGLAVYSLSELLRTLALHLDQTGNAFVEIVRNRAGRLPMRLSVLLPQYVRYVLRNDGDARRTMLYQLDPYMGERWFVPFGSRRAGDRATREYLHQRMPNTVSNVYGLPAWIEARQSVEVDNAHRAYLRAFFRSHAAPRWMIEVTQDPAWVGPQPEQQQVDQIRSLVVQYLSANAGEMAGRNLVLSYPGGIAVKATAMDAKIDDPTFNTTARNARDEILAVRHVSLVNMGLPEGGYRATAEQQSDSFERHALQPFMAPLLALLNRVLGSPQPYGLGITDYRITAELRDVDVIQQRIDSVIKATGHPVLSGDEGRILLGYEPIGNSNVLVPAGLVPVDTLAPPAGPDTGEALDDIDSQ